MSLYPLAYAGGEVKELNIGLMPRLVTSYEQGLTWRTAEIGKELNASIEKTGVKIPTWVWQAGCVASRAAAAVIDPKDVNGMKIRSGAREFDLMLKAAGRVISSLPSNEVRNAMQSGKLDAAITSATGLISFKVEDVARNLTTGRGKSFWFMLEPLLISKQVFDELAPAQQAVMVEAGESLVPFGLASAKAADQAIADIFVKGGAKIHDMTAVTVERQRGIVVD
ncbi:MAG: TRAP transporter substrate-binding protein DctP [Rhodospirillales bacterium]|nr:TRAP transporter substrate-binding protein DctP [Rhodospirillales bacterium]